MGGRGPPGSRRLRRSSAYYRDHGTVALRCHHFLGHAPPAVAQWSSTWVRRPPVTHPHSSWRWRTLGGGGADRTPYTAGRLGRSRPPRGYSFAPATGRAAISSTTRHGTFSTKMRSRCLPWWDGPDHPKFRTFACAGTAPANKACSLHPDTRESSAVFSAPARLFRFTPQRAGSLLLVLPRPHLRRRRPEIPGDSFTAGREQIIASTSTWVGTVSSTTTASTADDERFGTGSDSYTRGMSGWRHFTHRRRGSIFGLWDLKRLTDGDLPIRLPSSTARHLDTERSAPTHNVL